MSAFGRLGTFSRFSFPSSRKRKVLLVPCFNLNLNTSSGSSGIHSSLIWSGNQTISRDFGSWFNNLSKQSHLQRKLSASSMSSATPVSSLPQAVQFYRDKYLTMELDAKRSQYKCGDKYVTLKDVIDWPAYFSKANVQQFPGEGGKYQANSELNSKVSLWQGDITVLEIDSIVNAANSSLLGGGGVDGAIHRAAGGDLLNECRELRGCAAGRAKITGAYRLPAKYVIHTVGPQGEKPEVLRSAYVSSLDLMLQNQLRCIAFPCIATGVYGYPRVEAAHVALRTVREFLETNSDKVDRVIFTVFLEEDKQVYEELLQTYFPLQ